MEILLRDNKRQLVFENSRGLTFSEGGRRHMLAPDCTGLFDIACKDTPNAAYVSEAGEIIRMERLSEGWKKTVLLKSKHGNMDIFGLRLISTPDTLSLIYGLRHNSEKLIVHQRIPDSSPQVVASVFGDRFFVLRDYIGCIYVITEAAKDVWHFLVYRNGAWSGYEELKSGCRITGVMTDGYKSFCTLMYTTDECRLSYRDVSFAVKGEKPYIVRYGDEFMVISEYGGKVYCTDRYSTSPLITSDTITDYHLRLPDSGEYAVCEFCRGNIIHGYPRLFLIDRAKPPSAQTEGIGTELTKRIIELESRIARLETDMKDYKTTM